MRSLAVALVVAVAVSSAPAQTPDYEIKLARPPKVGQKYAIKAEGAMSRNTSYTIDGKDAGTVTDGFGVQLEGTVEVLGVNKDGEEGKAACTVTKCVRITDEGEKEIVPAGRVVTATGGKEDTTFAVDKGTLSEEAKAALDLVLRMGEEDGYNDDKIYGTSKRQPVGGTWDIDAKAASDEAAADDVKFDPKDITGSLKVEKVEKVDDVECLRIAGDTEVKKLSAKPPEGMKYDSGSLKARYWGLYPVDTNLGTLAESMSVTHTVRVRGKDPAGGKEMVVTSKVQRAIETKRTFLEQK
jgi:hypothetical protein